MSMPLHPEQLDFMKDLVLHRIEFLDPLFRFLNYFDSDYFFFVLIPVLWLGFSYRWGLRIFYWLTLNNLVNSFAKTILAWPRPSQDIPELGMFHPESYGFPSGGAQTCLFLGGILIYYWRTRAAWVIGISYILLISFSRLYLGVHYPTDLLGGWAVALVLLSLFILCKDPVEKFLAKIGPLPSLLLSLAIPLAILLIADKPNITYIMGSAMGIGLGTYFSLKYHLFLTPSKNLNEALARSFLGIAILFTLVWIWPTEWPLISKSLALGLFMSLATSPICRWFLSSKK